MIFVSYRRQDTQSATGRLCDKLQLRFGVERVFHDVESIAPGAEFVDTIVAKVGASAVVLAMIGPRWLDAGSGGRPRLSEPDDLVRLEIATALRRRIPIIPVLVEGATIPNTSLLPDELASLFDRQAHEISESRWQFDSDRLVEQLEKLVPAVETRESGDSSAWRDAIQALVGYAADFVQLLVHPRRHIVALLMRPNLMIRASVFFTVSQLIAAWLFVLPAVVASVPAFVLSGVPFGAFLLLLVAIPLHLAARMARVPSAPPVTLAICVYIESVAMVVIATGVQLMWTGLELGDSEIGLKMREVLYAARPIEVRLARVTDVIQAASSRVLVGLMLLAYVLWLYAAGWLVVASGAFRAAWRISRLRSAAVFALFTTMIGGIAGFVLFVALP